MQVQSSPRDVFDVSSVVFRACILCMHRVDFVYKILRYIGVKFSVNWKFPRREFITF